jgi:RHS repeat-associated protein
MRKQRGQACAGFRVSQQRERIPTPTIRTPGAAVTATPIRWRGLNVTYAYDANQNRISTTNELGYTTNDTFDNLNQLIEEQAPAPSGSGSRPTTTFSYDVFGNRTSLTDPDSNTTSWTYDLWGHMLHEISADTSVTQDREYQWDLLGNLIQKTDHLGRIISYSHDLLGRVTSEQWSTIASSTATTEIDYTYDKLGELLTADTYTPGSPNVYTSKYVYTYNHVGWQDSVELDQPGLVKVKLNNTFNRNGDRITQKADVTIAGTLTHDFENDYTFDGKDHEATFKQTHQGTGSGYATLADKYFTMTYDQLDEVTQVKDYANTSASNLVVQTDYTRDYALRLTGIDNSKGSTHFSTFAITNDARGRITEIDDVFSNSAWNETHVNTYDHDDQLTATDHSVQSDEAYGYDLNGNRTGSQTHLGATTSSTVTTDNHVSSDGIFNYTFDAEGNLISQTNIATGDKQEFTLDHRNRLMLVTFKNSSGVIQKTEAYTYDQNNEMITRTETLYTSGTAGTPTEDAYFYDGPQIVLAFHKGTSGNAAITDRFVWGVEQDHLLADEQATGFSSAGTVYWVTSDQLNSVRDALTYDSGTDTSAVAKHLADDSYGNVTSDTAPGIVIIFGTDGKYTDPSTGFRFHINRWYDPELGAWISEDPIKFGGGDTDLRRMVGNNPVDRLDPVGTKHVSLNVSVNISDVTLNVLNEETNAVMEPPGTINLGGEGKLTEKTKKGVPPVPTAPGHDLTDYVDNTAKAKVKVTIENNEKCPLRVESYFFFAVPHKMSWAEFWRMQKGGTSFDDAIGAGITRTHLMTAKLPITTGGTPVDGKFSEYAILSITAADEGGAVTDPEDHTIFVLVSEPWYVKE